MTGLIELMSRQYLRTDTPGVKYCAEDSLSIEIKLSGTKYQHKLVIFRYFIKAFTLIESCFTAHRARGCSHCNYQELKYSPFSKLTEPALSMKGAISHLWPFRPSFCTPDNKLNSSNTSHFAGMKHPQHFRNVFHYFYLAGDSLSV